MVGTELGKYRLERLLGKGGMGEVWAAYDPDLDRRIALKVLHPHVAAVEDARARFQREGRAMARLRHPNVITVHDATFSDGRGLIAMELVDGESLATWMMRAHAAADVVRVLVAAGRGLAAAHTAGLVHRDFKPHNVLIDREDRVLVTDFGLARSTSADDDATERPRASEPVPARSEEALADTVTPNAETVATAPSRPSAPTGDLGTPLTATGALLGTPAYMAPEQIAGEPTDARTDIFAFCVTAWELFSGERPFRGKTLAELGQAMERRDVRGADRVPRRLRGVLLRGLAVAPDARWQTMTSLLDAIERAWHRPRRLAIASAGLALASVAIAVVVAMRTRGDGGAQLPAGCDDSARAVATAWSPQIRADLEAVIDKPFVAGALGFFDRWAADWTERHAATCAKPDDRIAAERRRCLETIRDELALVMERRATVPPAMWTAPDLPRVIPLPEACMHDPAGVAPAAPPAEVKDEVTKIRIELALARIPLVARSPLALASDLSSAVARARATGYRPVIVEATLLDAVVKLARAYNLDRKQLGAACQAIGDAAIEAESARYDRMVVEALLVRYECLDTARASPDELRHVLDRLRTFTERNRNPFQIGAVAYKLASRALDDGDYPAALAHATRGCETFDQLALADEQARCRREMVDVLVEREAPGDLERAAALLREAIAKDTRHSPDLRLLLARIEWQRTGVADLPVDHPLPGARDGGRVVVHVADATGPVAGAEVGIARWLYADSARAMMAERKNTAMWLAKSTMVGGTTNAGGTLEIEVPKHALVFARAGDRSGLARVTGDRVDVRLAPSARVTGTTTGVHDAPRATRPDPETRAAHRRTGTALLVRDLGDARFIALAPIDASGAWRIANIPPGRYRLAVQAETGLDGVIGVQTWIELAAGDNTAPALAIAARPRVVEVITRPSATEVVVFDDRGGKLPATWDALLRQLEHARWLAGDLFTPTTITDPETQPGDGIIRAPVTGPAIACAFPGDATYVDAPLGAPRPRPGPVRCARIAAGATRVVIR